MTTIGTAATLTGLTVRTLHHYDEIGLVRPSGRSEAGYRLYSPEDLRRLQEVLGWRALGFSLKAIADMLAAPDHDRGAALRRQRELVAAEAERLETLAAALDAAIAAHDTGAAQEVETMFDGFDQYADEARERWGHTQAYAESQRRARSYDKATWKRLGEESEDISRRFAELMRSGAPADGPEAIALAEEHRAHISRWFYACSPEMHRGLGELYTADTRFAAHWDAFEPGLTPYVTRAFAAAADASG